jgi:hypothetical protein
VVVVVDGVMKWLMMMMVIVCVGWRMMIKPDTNERGERK